MWVPSSPGNRIHFLEPKVYYFTPQSSSSSSFIIIIVSPDKIIITPTLLSSLHPKPTSFPPLFFPFHNQKSKKSHLGFRVLQPAAGREMADKKENHGGGGGGGGGEEEKIAGLFYSQKLGYDLMQNCDLPPPMKVYANNNLYAPKKKPVLQRDEAFLGVEIPDKISDSGNEKLELLKALRLSQSRAREAEKKATLLSKEKNDLAGFLFRQSMELFAYKHWMKTMEFGVSKLEKQQEEEEGAEPRNRAESNPNWDEQNGAQGMTFLVAVAICVSIAGAGFLSFFTSHWH